MTNATAKQITMEAFGFQILVEQLGRGAMATILDGKFAGSHRFASTKQLAFEILKDAIAEALAKEICEELTAK